MIDTEQDQILEMFETCLDYCANRALKAYRSVEPQSAAQILAAFKAGKAQSEVTITSGGGKAASLRVVAIMADGTRQPLAVLKIELSKIN